MELLQIEDRRLSGQEVLSDVLLVVSTLGVFLVDLVDELLDFVGLLIAKANVVGNDDSRHRLRRDK